MHKMPQENTSLPKYTNKIYTQEFAVQFVILKKKKKNLNFQTKITVNESKQIILYNVCLFYFCHCR